MGWNPFGFTRGVDDLEIPSQRNTEIAGDVYNRRLSHQESGSIGRGTWEPRRGSQPGPFTDNPLRTEPGAGSVAPAARPSGTDTPPPPSLSDSEISAYTVDSMDTSTPSPSAVRPPSPLSRAPPSPSILRKTAYGPSKEKRNSPSKGVTFGVRGEEGTRAASGSGSSGVELATAPIRSQPAGGLGLEDDDL